MTGQESVSLGRAEYVAALEAFGFLCDGFRVDEGENHYYLATRR